MKMYSLRCMDRLQRREHYRNQLIALIRSVGCSATEGPRKSSMTSVPAVLFSEKNWSKTTIATTTTVNAVRTQGVHIRVNCVDWRTNGCDLIEGRVTRELQLPIFDFFRGSRMCRKIRRSSQVRTNSRRNDFVVNVYRKNESPGLTNARSNVMQLRSLLSSVR